MMEAEAELGAGHVIDIGLFFSSREKKCTQ